VVPVVAIVIAVVVMVVVAVTGVRPFARGLL
jgi:hypothetical protein